MYRRHAVVWAVSGLLAGAVGWLAGGSILWRTVLAATAIAAVLGALAGRPRLALVAGFATAAVTGAAFLAGRSAITPLIAWPAAGLALGVAGAALLHRTRARVATVVAVPLLGSLGFVLGVVATGFAGFATNDARLLGQVLGGGAAGFGLLATATIRLLGARLDRVAPTTGGVA